MSVFSFGGHCPQAPCSYVPVSTSTNVRYDVISQPTLQLQLPLTPDSCSYLTLNPARGLVPTNSADR